MAVVSKVVMGEVVDIVVVGGLIDVVIMVVLMVVGEVVGKIVVCAYKIVRIILKTCRMRQGMKINWKK